MYDNIENMAQRFDNGISANNHRIPRYDNSFNHITIYRQC